MILLKVSGFMAPYGQTMMQVQQPMHFSASCTTSPVSLSMLMAPDRQAVTQGVSLHCWHLIEMEYGLFVSTLTRLSGRGCSRLYAFIGSLDLECSTVQWTWQRPHPMHASSLIETRFIVFAPKD